MIEIVEIDLSSPEHTATFLDVMSAYAKDEMGGAKALDPQVKTRLVAGLRARSNYLGFLAFAGNRGVGLTNCFEGFSTFMAVPTLNIHDVFVTKDARGQGLAQRLLARVESEARARGCGKLTLEVLEDNEPAQAAYRKFGFEACMHVPVQGRALFWEKKLL